ncbi:MAG TPA: Txe/YoeB family addiction module toxin [Prolixibacteraceae bacterium]|nr:Txe/YoeB family addiction module toxin [Prolixibacteraceae bacterium]
MNDITFSQNAWEDYLYWQMQDKKTLKRINELLKDIQRNGLSDGIGKPEPLKHRKAWSRRIDYANRLIYHIGEQQNIVIIACRGHYED